MSGTEYSNTMRVTCHYLYIKNCQHFWFLNNMACLSVQERKNDNLFE